MKPLLLLITALCTLGCTATQPKSYADYSVSSGFTLDSLAAADSQLVDNLETLCRVWGYTKYHHPVFCNSTHNADYELFELLPRVAHADKAMRNQVMHDWVKGLGAYKADKAVYDTKLAGKELRTTADLSWTADTTRLGCGLSALLQDLRYAERGKNSYASFAQGSGNLVMNESTAGSLGDCGYRLLYLFRFWNAIEYFAPNRNLTDTDWGAIPAKYIPLFIGKPGPGTPEVAMLQRELCDSHSVACQYNMFGYKTIPTEVRTADGRVFVTADGPLHKGDEILSIDGRGWKQTHDGLTRFEPASNEENRNYMATKCMVSTHRDTAVVELIRCGQKLTMQLPTRSIGEWSPYEPERMLDTANMRLIADGVGYMTGVHYTAAAGDQIMQKFRDTKALIVDMRCYPREFMIFDFIARHFLPQTTPHVKWVTPTGILPGVFQQTTDHLTVDPVNPPTIGNPDYYKGRVIVLVDSSTQSQAEYTAMSFQAAPRCTVVGTQTAGADGNVSSLVMPGGPYGCFSGLGVLYPDGTDTQRAGVRIDVPVRATVEGLQAGRDEILEKALEIIRTGDYDPANKKG